MNIIDLQERLKDLPENALMQEMQAPTGTAPQFLVLSELKRRKRMRDEYQRQEAQGMQTVAEEAITAAGMPQEGIMGLAQGMAPRSAIAQDTGVNDMMQQDSVRAPQPEQPMMMAGGGVLKMQTGGFADRLRRVQEEGYLAFLNIMNLQDSPESREMYAQYGQTPAAAGGTMPDETRARLDLISRMTDPDSSFMNQLDQFSARLSDFGTQTQPMDEAPQGIASISADVSSFLPSMPGADSRLNMMTAPPVLGAAPTADGIDFDASADPSVTQSRLSPNRNMMTDNALDPRLDMVPGSALFKQQQQEVDDFNRRVAEQTAYETARDTAPLSDEPYTFDAFGNIVTDPDEAARIQYAQEQGLPYPGEMPPPYEIPPGGLDRVVKGLREIQVIGETSGPGEGLDPITGGSLLPDAAAATPDATPDAAANAAAKTPGGGGGGGGGGGAGGFGPIESRIARMLEEREKSAEADKWLALAQTGLALMASDQPTLGGAIGEAGLSGIGAMQQARSQYDKDIMGLLDMQAGVQRARAAGAKSETVSGTERVAYFNAANAATIEAAKLERQLTIGGEVGEFGEVRPYTPEEKALLERQLKEARSRANMFSGLSNPALANYTATE
jgi:hypothetical protein